MFATQVLRILQTVNSDVRHETCVSNSAPQDMIMTENQCVTTQVNNRSFRRDSEAVGSKEMYQLTGLKRETHASLCEVKGTEDDRSMENQNRTRNSTFEEFQPSCSFEILEDDNGRLSSDTNVKDEVQTRPEHDLPIASGQSVGCSENESGDCRLPYVIASDLFERESLFADKNVLEYEHPELIVCYKEINYHVVKDICVDEGVPSSRKILIDSSEDSHPSDSFPRSLNGDNHHHKANGSIDDEPVNSNGLVTTSQDKTAFTIANQHGSNNESNGIKLVTQDSPKLPLDSSLYNDAATGCNLEESNQKGVRNFGATCKTAKHSSDEEFRVDRTLPIQEYGTRSFLRSFLNSLDDEGNKVKQMPDQFSSGPAATSTVSEPNKDLPSSILCYKSKVETSSITFNFNPLEPAAGDITSGKTEVVEEQPLDLGEVMDQKDAEADILPKSRQVQWSSRDTIYSSQSDLSLKSSHALQHDPVVRSQRNDQGESKFTSDDFITHSGPIPFSGNISLCSDGSGKSFAFPILQAEWSSSPVRMSEADRRRFRKHKGWRSGLLCCRF